MSPLVQEQVSLLIVIKLTLGNKVTIPTIMITRDDGWKMIDFMNSIIGKKNPVSISAFFEIVMSKFTVVI